MRIALAILVMVSTAFSQDVLLVVEAESMTWDSAGVLSFSAGQANIYSEGAKLLYNYTSNDTGSVKVGIVAKATNVSTEAALLVWSYPSGCDTFLVSTTDWDTSWNVVYQRGGICSLEFINDVRTPTDRNVFVDKLLFCTPNIGKVDTVKISWNPSAQGDTRYYRLHLMSKPYSSSALEAICFVCDTSISFIGYLDYERVYWVQVSACDSVGNESDLSERLRFKYMRNDVNGKRFRLRTAR